jgi:anti-sigma regulatory factor (Ser/Thr protein kinase)
VESEGVRRFDRAPESIAEIRTWIRRALSVARPTEDVLDAAELMVSEVATNAVRYGAGSRITVRWYVRDAIEVAVFDENAHRAPRPRPRPRQALPEDVSGRGLELVQALAAS